MERSIKSPSSLPPFSIIILAVVLGALLGIGGNQLSRSNFSWSKLPQFFADWKISSPQIKEERTQTILKEENAIIEVVEKASPSVVAVGASRRIFNPFDPFSLPKRENATIGTGFVVSEKGIIVTNKHVVANTTTQYSIVSRDGKKYDVKKIYRDPVLDLAIIQIDSHDLKALELGDSTKLKVGQTVIAIGNALGKFTNTVTTGVVSGLGRKVVAGDPFTGSTESLDDLIQTDAAINPGNSGGPLLNSAGQVIGVNVAISDEAQNIGFAIPINAVKQIVEEFIQKGSVSRPFLGVRYQFITKEMAIFNEVPQGAYIQEVVANSPAEKAGLKEGDIIIKANGEKIDSENQLSKIIASKKVGDILDLIIWTDGKEKELKATLQELPNQ